MALKCGGCGQWTQTGNCQHCGHRNKYRTFPFFSLTDASVCENFKVVASQEELLLAPCSALVQIVYDGPVHRVVTSQFAHGYHVIRKRKIAKYIYGFIMLTVSITVMLQYLTLALLAGHRFPVLSVSRCQDLFEAPS